MDFNDGLLRAVLMDCIGETVVISFAVVVGIALVILGSVSVTSTSFDLSHLTNELSESNVVDGVIVCKATSTMCPKCFRDCISIFPDLPKISLLEQSLIQSES